MADPTLSITHVSDWLLPMPREQACRRKPFLRAINKGVEKDSAALIETTYEGKGPHGIAIFVEATTDNIQRTVSNVRAYFNKHGGEMGKNGSLNYLFDRKGIFVVPIGTLNPEDFEMEVIEAGAEDINLEEGLFTITTCHGGFRKHDEEIGAVRN